MPISTGRSNKNAKAILVKYLEECEYKNTNFIPYPADEFNRILAKFEVAVRKQKKKPKK